ncbi:MAG: hypothetical protein QM497_03330 [Sulfurimonas sp.]
MKKLKDSEIIRKFPDIYGVPPFDPMKSLMCFGFDCEEGWYPLLLKLSEDIQKILDENNDVEIRVTQVKEKYGELAYYLMEQGNNEAIAKIDKLVDDVENQSTKICELCGESGSLVKVGNWWMTRCEKCLKS